MVVIDAHWEKRNLGVSCHEIYFDNADSIDTVRETVLNLDSEYQVAKVPAGAIDLLYFLQSHGFVFIEMNFHLEKNLKTLTLPPLLKRFQNMITAHKPSEEELLAILEVVKQGVFDTDRIALDPRFGIQKSGTRYYNWINDELDAGSFIYLLKYNDIPFGFDLLKKVNDKRYNALFGAVFPEAQTIPGVGVFLPYFNCLKASEMGGIIIETNVSSNNLAALRSNQNIGFDITSLTYNLVKHS